MASPFREWIERLLPWYEPAREQARDARTERIRRRSIASRVRAERVIAEYRAAERTSDAAVERVIEEARRDDG